MTLPAELFAPLPQRPCPRCSLWARPNPTRKTWRVAVYLPADGIAEAKVGGVRMYLWCEVCGMEWSELALLKKEEEGSPDDG